MKFTWNAWDYDCDGEAYIIAKRVCPTKEEVPDFICRVDNIHEQCKIGMEIQEGWCKWQVRSDWMGDGGNCGWYVVEEEQFAAETLNIYGKRKRGWFPVWIVRKGEWY